MGTQLLKHFQNRSKFEIEDGKSISYSFTNRKLSHTIHLVPCKCEKNFPLQFFYMIFTNKVRCTKNVLPFTEEILNGKPHFLFSGHVLRTNGQTSKFTVKLRNLVTFEKREYRNSYLSQIRYFFTGTKSFFVFLFSLSNFFNVVKRPYIILTFSSPPLTIH